MATIEIITTQDGFHTLLNTDLNETYHSHHGAGVEAAHVFIEAGLKYSLNNKNTINLLEVGFGTGLNAILTLKEVLNQPYHIHYVTLEPFPVNEQLLQQLNYGTLLKDNALEQLFHSLHQASWQTAVPILSNFILEKYPTKLEDFIPSKKFDLVYFDAFAPAKQPELWEIKLLEKVKNMLAPNGVIVTYCAKGEFKRNLKALGLEVEALPGPLGGKREMVRASLI